MRKSHDMRMPIRSNLMSLMLVLAGMLVGVACSDDIGAMAEDVADSVAAIVAAGDVTYDPTTSALVATDVQAALDELDKRLDDTPDIAGVQATVETVQASVGAVEGRVATLEAVERGAALAALTERVEALEAEKVAVEEALQGLQAVDAGLQAVDAGLQQAVDAFGSCGEDFYDLGPSCMQKTPESTSWNNARGACNGAGLRLCGFAEYLWACGTGTLDTSDDPEWTGTVLGPDGVLLSQMENANCGLHTGVIESSLGTIHAYRCCHTK
jgi:hypothetical protein